MYELRISSLTFSQRVTSILAAADSIVDYVQRT